jgi:Tol biopolymer transport system component
MRKLTAVLIPILALPAMAKDVMLMNRIGPFSADGKEVVFRSWGSNEMGLRILNLQDQSVRVLTNVSDNLPYWSPDGSWILFTRKQDDNFDIYTIKPYGTDVRRLTTFPANDAHAVWSQDGKDIMWNSSEYGFKDEAALYDNSFQPTARSG